MTSCPFGEHPAPVPVPRPRPRRRWWPIGQGMGDAPNPTGGRLSFIGSFPDDADQAVIVLRGPIDTSTVDRLADHVEDLLGIRTRFLAIDATAVDSYDERLLDLLGSTQHRLETRHGLLTVRGLHPCLLDAPTPPPPATDPVCGAKPPTPAR